MTTKDTGMNDITGDNVPTAQGKTVATKPWIVEGPSNGTSGFKMVCFPPTGAGPSFFTSWTSYVAKFGIQLLMVHLPGCEGREAENPSHSLQEIVDNVIAELIYRLQDRKFVFFGHSMGSLIAFETAHQLLAHNLRSLHLFLSAWYAPTIIISSSRGIKECQQKVVCSPKVSARNGKRLFKICSQRTCNKDVFLG